MHRWDWESGERVILDTTRCTQQYEWQEEIYTSSDGMSIAAVVRLDDGDFTVCRNGALWNKTYERAWYLRYAPDNRLTALVSADETWSLSVDDTPWDLDCDMVWDTRFSKEGNAISVAIQQDMKYGMALNGQVWPELYDNANHFTLSDCGTNTAAVVQTRPIRQAEIEAFQDGCFTVAVNGIRWSPEFTNVWQPVFAPGPSPRVAAPVRVGLYDYSIAVNGIPWKTTFSSIWEPLFSNTTDDILAPVRINGNWGLVRNGHIFWEPAYVQLWNPVFGEDDTILAAVAAVSFGQWTVVVNNSPWESRFDVVTDLTLGKDNQTLAAVVKKNQSWSMAVNDTVWPQWFERVWPPVISPAGNDVAARIKNGNRFTIALNGVPLDREFTRAWDPVFSPDGSKVLVRGVIDGRYIRQVVPVENWKTDSTLTTPVWFERISA